MRHGNVFYLSCLAYVMLCYMLCYLSCLAYLKSRSKQPKIYVCFFFIFITELLVFSEEHPLSNNEISPVIEAKSLRPLATEQERDFIPEMKAPVAKRDEPELLDNDDRSRVKEVLLEADRVSQMERLPASFANEDTNPIVTSPRRPSSDTKQESSVQEFSAEFSVTLGQQSTGESLTSQTYHTERPEESLVTIDASPAVTEEKPLVNQEFHQATKLQSRNIDEIESPATLFSEPQVNDEDEW